MPVYELLRSRTLLPAQRRGVGAQLSYLPQLTWSESRPSACCSPCRASPEIS
jgi:hypothetical protein